MTNSEKIKKLVKEKYGEIAIGKKSCCCTSSSCCGDDNSYSNIIDIIGENYSSLEGYNPDADLGLGCGIPTDKANIKEGDTVVDLGSGAGNDVFVARRLVGEKGKVIGIDMTLEMINKAKENNEKLGYKNIEFKFGDIENLPLENDIADIVISNCVLNLVPNKVKAFSEIYRVLKQDGHFSISDIVFTGYMPENLKSLAEAYIGCISGAIQKDEYISIIKDAGFKNIKILSEKEIEIPQDLIFETIADDEIDKFKEFGLNIISINVFAEK